jgi:hypothetical protein
LEGVESFSKGRRIEKRKREEKSPSELTKIQALTSSSADLCVGH